MQWRCYHAALMQLSQTFIKTLSPTHTIKKSCSLRTPVSSEYLFASADLHDIMPVLSSILALEQIWCKYSGVDTSSRLYALATKENKRSGLNFVWPAKRKQKRKLHSSRKKVPVLIGATCIVKKYTDTFDPRMISNNTGDASGKKQNGVVCILRPNPLIKNTNRILGIPMIHNTQNVEIELLQICGAWLF